MRGSIKMAITTEKDVERTLILHASQCGSTLFKNEVGAAWQGEMDRYNSSIPQRIMLKNCRRVAYGLCTGSSDLIGWTPVTITPEMVGKKVAVFTAVEVKKNKFGKYRATDEQKHFITAVKNNGGMAGVADCMADLERIIHV